MRWDAHYYEPILDAIAGRRVALIQNDVSGNYGDEMIHRGTLALFKHWCVNYQVFRESTMHPAVSFGAFDVVALFGSGSVGKICSDVGRRRRKIADLGKPCILLPSTAFDTCEDLSYCEAVFMRENVSTAMYRCIHPNVMLCPDMAMFLELPAVKQPPDSGDVDVYYRGDNAAVGGLPFGDSSKGDPVDLAANVDDYIQRACGCRALVTNRLHFGIAAALHGNAVTIAPTSWHKNRAFYDTWFSHLPNVHWLDA